MWRMDKLRAIQTFIQIAERGSLTAAAAALELSPPTVVRSLAELERHLGVTLFNRTTRRVRLTEEGRHYLESARAALAHLEDAESLLSSRHARPSGHLVVTASALLGRLYVGSFVNAFLKRHPEVSIDLVLLDRVVDLVEEGVDVAFRVGTLRDSSLHAAHLGDLRRVVCASPAYLRRHGTPKRPEDLARHSAIRFSGLARSDRMRFIEEGREVEIKLAPRFVSNAFDVALQACVDGIGVGQFVYWAAEPLVREGKLKLLLQSYYPPGSPVHVVYPHARLMSTKLRVFVDEAVRHLRPLMAGVG